MTPTRRTVVIAGGTAALAAFAVIEGRSLLRKRYAPSPYDDLLARLDDRDADAQLGEAVLPQIDDFDGGAIARELRTRLARQPLADAAARDARDGRVIEAGGWVLPETLALLCALAAKATA